MTHERWEQILFAHVPDEVVQDMLNQYVLELEAENANLKKLVRDVYTLNWNGFDCTECPWFDECRTEGGCPWLGILHDHMRELGVKAR